MVFLGSRDLKMNFESDPALKLFEDFKFQQMVFLMSGDPKINFLIGPVLKFISETFGSSLS